MNRTASLLVAGALSAGILLLAGCTPTGNGTTPSPDPTQPSSPQTSAPSVAPSEGGTVDPLPKEEYPAEVDGWVLDFVVAVPVYEKTTENRISIMAHSRRSPASEFFAGVDAGHQELRTNVWCYVDSSGLDSCTTNGTTGRMWITRDQFDTLTPDELAAWTEQFAAQIP